MLLPSQGKECRVITEELIKALGDVITTENTEEYFEEKIVNVQHVRTTPLCFVYMRFLLCCCFGSLKHPAVVGDNDSSNPRSNIPHMWTEKTRAG